MGERMEQAAESKESQQQQQAEGQRFYHAQTGFQLIISLSDDEIECRGHLEQKPSDSPLTLDALKAFIAADGISEGVDEQALQQLIDDAKNNPSSNGLLATGSAPQIGDNGQLSYSVEVGDKTVKESTEGTEEPQKVDFRSVQQFVNVDTDQEIGRILPPTNGTPGKTVRGKYLPGIPGKPLLIKLGKNVRTAENDPNTLISEIHGRVKFDGETISVEEEYVVDGDVDFSVGNIRFNGIVDIKGDVLDGFQVSASKGIRIKGNVGASRLISHGDISFCGMDGQGKGSIVCSGSITAHFIHNTTVESWGAMNIDVELRDCSIQCRKDVICGVMAGGDCIAIGGIEAKKLGAPSAVKTKVHAGADYRDIWRLAELYESLEKVQKELGSAHNMDEAKALGAEKQKLAASIIEVRNRKHPEANSKINIKDKLYEGVTVLLGNSVEEFTAEVSGPISLIENSVEGGLRRLSLTPLQVNASELEHVCAENDEKERIARELAAAEEREKEAQAALENELLESALDQASSTEDAKQQPEAPDDLQPEAQKEDQQTS
jgi:uncharacterized protein